MQLGAPTVNYRFTPSNLAPADARYRAQVRVARGECRYAAAYRAEGLCGQCGRVPSVKHNCDPCRERRQHRERATRARQRARFAV